MTIEYRGRTLAVEETGDEREPYRLVGKRGGALTLVPHAKRRGLFFVKLADGRLQGGFVGQLSDGRLLWLPSSGPRAAAAQRIWRDRHAA